MTLGCGHPRAFIQSVGGTNPITELAVSNVSWGRRLDELSDGRVVLGETQDAACLPVLASLTPFSHELAIWRDSEEVWVGPVSEPIYTLGGLTIPARDLFQWFERRLLPFDRVFTDVDLSVIAAAYIDDALSRDNTPAIATDVNLCGITGTRSVASTAFRRAADEIRELARTGLDFTVVRRRVIFGGIEIAVPNLPTLTADIFEVGEVRLAGLEMGNEITVFGSPPEGVTTPIYGQAGGVDVPLVQQTYSEPSILDLASATSAAETRYALLRSAPLYVTGRLLESAPVSMADLIPGAHAKFVQQVGFRSFDETMRLVAVDVDATASDDGETETVRLTMQPLGAVEGGG